MPKRLLLLPPAQLMLLMAIPLAMHGQTVEQATEMLAAQIAAHLSAGETPHIVIRNISSIPAEKVAGVKTGLERALPRHARNGLRVDVTVTISENVNGYLLVAQIRDGERESVEMVPFKVEATPSRPAALLTMTKRLVWEQEKPMLDVAIVGDQMLELEPERLVRYQKENGRWMDVESAQINAAAVRDPRGRLALEGERVSVYLETATCRGGWQPLSLTCEAGTANFLLGGVPVHFTPGRNTLEGELRPNLEGFGDALPVCGTKFLASGAGGMDAPDTVTLFEGTTAASEAAEFPGPVTALWPMAEGALAIALNLSTQHYEAYALALDCGH